MVDGIRNPLLFFEIEGIINWNNLKYRNSKCMYVYISHLIFNCVDIVAVRVRPFRLYAWK